MLFPFMQYFDIMAATVDHIAHVERGLTVPTETEYSYRASHVGALSLAWEQLCAPFTLLYKRRLVA